MTSSRRLLDRVEVWEFPRSDDEGDYAQLRYLHELVLWQEGTYIYRSVVPGDPGEPVDLAAIPALEPLPVHLTWTPWKPSYTEATDSVSPSSVFVKTPKYMELDDEPGSVIALRDRQRREIEVYEMLRLFPQRNIGVYHGCIRVHSPEGLDVASAMVLHRYPITLVDAMKAGRDPASIPLDRRRVCAGVKAGLEHLHGLGLAHNDVTPFNIVLDARGEPALIDFESTSAEGETKDPLEGTHLWFRPNSKSERSNDMYALGLIARFLDGAVPGSEPWEEIQKEDSWTDEYLALKVLVLSTASTPHVAQACVKTLISDGCFVTAAISDRSVDLPAACRAVPSTCQDEDTLSHVLSKAGEGLRPGDVDVVLHFADDIHSGTDASWTQVRTLASASKSLWVSPCSETAVQGLPSLSRTLSDIVDGDVLVPEVLVVAGDMVVCLAQECDYSP